MSLLLVILAAIGVLVVMAAQAGGAGRDAGSAGSNVIGLFAGPRPRRRIDADPFERIGDPMLAATAMMRAVAGEPGAMTETEMREIQAQMCWYFQIDGKTAEKIFAAAEPIAGRPADLTEFLPRLRGPIVDCCTLRERENLIQMLFAVAQVAGPPSDAQSAAIDRLRPHLGLPRG